MQIVFLLLIKARCLFFALKGIVYLNNAILLVLRRTNYELLSWFFTYQEGSSAKSMLSLNHELFAFGFFRDDRGRRSSADHGRVTSFSSLPLEEKYVESNGTISGIGCRRESVSSSSGGQLWLPSRKVRLCQHLH